jgi:ABC-type transporter Mla subunit MlaD
MSTPTNELDALLMESLQQLSEEFQQREARMTAQYKSCVESFTKQSTALRQEQSALSKRLDDVTQHYVETKALMQRVSKQLDVLSKKLDQR